MPCGKVSASPDLLTCAINTECVVLSEMILISHTLLAHARVTSAPPSTVIQTGKKTQSLQQQQHISGSEVHGHAYLESDFRLCLLFLEGFRGNELRMMVVGVRGEFVASREDARKKKKQKKRKHTNKQKTGGGFWVRERRETK